MSGMYIDSIGHEKFLVQLFSVIDIPDRVGFNLYYEGICEVSLPDALPIQQDCIIHRPSNRRNVVGVQTTDWLILIVKTELAREQLKGATIRVVRFDGEITELEAKTRAQQ